MGEELEQMVEQKVKPILDKAMHRKLGITVSELGSDITDKLKKSSLLSFRVDTSIPFKQAKKKFRQEYIARLLQLNFGNVAEVAKLAGIDRRSVHRVVAEMKLNVQNLRENVLQKGAYVKQLAVQDIIEESIEAYKKSLHPRKFKALYQSAPELSKNIMEKIPEKPQTLKYVMVEFEKRYFRKVLKESNGNISQAARKMKIRFETLHRKLKQLELIKI